MNETKKFSGLVTSFLHKIFFLFFKSWCKMANFWYVQFKIIHSLRSYTNMLISQCLHLQEIKAQGFKSSSSTSFRIYKLSKWISSAWPFIPMGIFQNQVLNAKGMINVKWQVNNYELRYKIVSMLYSNRQKSPHFLGSRDPFGNHWIVGYLETPYLLHKLLCSSQSTYITLKIKLSI